MTNTAKDNDQLLSWTSTKEWGSVGNTYRAESDGWKYTADSPRKGQWTVRGWNADGEFKLYVLGVKTLKAAKVYAEDNAASVRKDVQLADAALKIIPAAADSAAAGLQAMADIVRGLDFQGRARNLVLSHQPCGCPSPTHRMSCGEGGRVKVVANHWSRLIAAEGPQQASGRWSVTQPELTVFTARKGGAA